MTPEQIRAKRRRHYERNREKIKAASRAYYAEHKEERLAYAAAYKRGQRARPNGVTATCHPDRPHFAKGQCQPCYHRDYYELNKDNWRRVYGYDAGQYDRLLAEQAGCCALCGKRERLVPDHDHATGLPRRLLCDRCNKALGMFADDPELLAKAAQYVYAHRPLEVVPW